MRHKEHQKNVVFKNGELELEVNVTPEKDTVWLTQDQMSTLFDTARFSIAYHISNIFKEGELNKETSVEIFDRSLNKASRPPMYSNLDVIISVGYHVKSQRGIAFRKWATSILKDYMLKGYAVNKKRLKVLNKTIEIQSRMLATAYELDEKELLDVIEAYQNTLSLLDDYDHGSLSKLEGTDFIYRLTYEECRELIDKMKFESDVFGVEKEKGKLNGILAAVYQNIFGQELYPSVEEKASNLLYFLIKDHPFADGCKRIGVTIFLEFLNKNHHLIIDGKQIISDSALVAITLMIAESRPEEKETMVKLVMNFLVKN